MLIFQCLARRKPPQALEDPKIPMWFKPAFEIGIINYAECARVVRQEPTHNTVFVSTAVFTGRRHPFSCAVESTLAISALGKTYTTGCASGIFPKSTCNNTNGRLEFAHAWPSCAIRHLNQDHVASLPESSKDPSLQGQSRQYRHWEHRAEQAPLCSRVVTTRPLHNVHRLHRLEFGSYFLLGKSGRGSRLSGG